MVPREENNDLDVLSIESFNELVTEYGPETIHYSQSGLRADLVRLLSTEAPDLGLPELEQILDSSATTDEKKKALQKLVEKMSHEQACQTVVDTIVQRYHAKMEEENQEAPLLLQIEALTAICLEEGEWNEDFEELFELLLNRAEKQRADYDSYPIQDQEWTIESFVGDYLLNNGLTLYTESLEDLISHLRVMDEQGAELALDWLAEGFFYFAAANEWSRNPWI